MTVSYHTSTTIPAGAPATAGNAGRPATPAPQTPNVAQLAPAPLPRRRRGGWALWGAAAGALGLVATVITDPQGAVSSKEGLTAEAVDHVSRTGYHVGVVAGLVAMGCLLVAAAGWRRWAAERAPHDLAARVVSMAMVASAGAMMIGYGLKGSMAVYLPGGIDEGNFSKEGLFSLYMFLDLGSWMVWWGVTVAAVAMIWLSLHGRLLPRWVGFVSLPFVLAPLAFLFGTGLPGFTAVDSLWLVVVSLGTAIGERRRAGRAA